CNNVMVVGSWGINCVRCHTGSSDYGVVPMTGKLQAFNTGNPVLMLTGVLNPDIVPVTYSVYLSFCNIGLFCGDFTDSMFDLAYVPGEHNFIEFSSVSGVLCN